MGNAWLSYSYYATGDFQGARTACEAADESNKPICFALVYEKLGRYEDAQNALLKLETRTGQSAIIALIYAQWGKTARALDALENAMHHRDPYLIKVRTNIFLDPLRKEPRFQAIERELRFPD